MALAPGERLGPYVIKSLLGVGGMGEVYRGHDDRLGRDVALKVIAPALLHDPSLRRRFELEARAASALNHPAIVTVYDVGETAGTSWIAMEWIDGRTLRAVLAEGALPVREAVALTRQIAHALAAAHAKGIVHRDLKPENVMIAADGQAKILDFGLARQTLVDSLEGSLTETVTARPRAATMEGAILGTVGYMSPEQASGRPADFRSDQFALGLLAYEILTGRRAFVRPTAVETLSAIIREEPEPIGVVRGGSAAGIQRVIARCLSKRPEDRFETTRELAAACELIGGEASDDEHWPVAAPEATGLPAHSAATRAKWWASRTGLMLAAGLVIVLAAAGWYRFAGAPAAIQSLAVLPFANASGDPEAEYLGDGLTESLIDQLTRLPSLKVMARATVFRFKGTSDPQAAGRRLGVGAILSGSVARRGDRLAVSAELVEIATGVRLWGDTFDRPFADLIRVQDSIASDISGALRLHLSGQEKRTLAAHGTENAEAYELFLRARYLMAGDTEEDDLEARRLLQQAIAIDPQFLDAHLGVMSTYSRMAGNGYASPAEARAGADAELQKALAIDPGNVQVRAAVANRQFLFDRDWVGADRTYRELSSDPQLFVGNQFHPITLFYASLGRTEEALALMERALRVDPENIESRIMHGNYLAQAGRLEDSITAYRGVIAEDPSDPRPLYGLADVLRRRGDVKGAIDTLRKAYELDGEEQGARMLATARTDKDYENAEVAVARNRLGDLEQLAKERYVSPFDIGRLHALIGARDKAFAFLELALVERSVGLGMLKVDPSWDRIRDDPRFADVVRRVGIP